MRIYYDTEFLERGPDYPLMLVSLGMVREDGQALYRINGEVDLQAMLAHEFLAANVLPHLPVKVVGAQLLWDERHPDMHYVASRRTIADQVAEFITGTLSPAELWSYYADYDHVVLAQLWGTMANLPPGVPMYTNDLKQELLHMGDKTPLVERPDKEHHALHDAYYHLRIGAWVHAAWGRMYSALETVGEEWH